MKKIILILFILLYTLNISYSQTWSPLGSGVNNFALKLTVYNNELIAGGTFTTAGGVSANYIAKWNGTTWSTLGSGMDSIINCKSNYNTIHTLKKKYLKLQNW